MKIECFRNLRIVAVNNTREKRQKKKERRKSEEKKHSILLTILPLTTLSTICIKTLSCIYSTRTPTSTIGLVV